MLPAMEEVRPLTPAELRAVRKGLNLTHEEFAELLDRSVGCVKAWQATAGKPPKLLTYALIAITQGLEP